jgi:hypothetical protein
MLQASRDKALLQEELHRQSVAEQTNAELLYLQKEREKRQALAHLQSVSARNVRWIGALPSSLTCCIGLPQSPYTSPYNAPYSPLSQSFSPHMPSQTPLTSYHHVRSLL